MLCNAILCLRCLNLTKLVNDINFKFFVNKSKDFNLLTQLQAAYLHLMYLYV